ncbi:MAG: hypothetical protein RMM17_06385 [Acidobacteriota bacterium]|nr:hypothetical protein [Blastocatellia bacterium]MDW8412291.1 hypothetical protein [Acidobacteriota bacterium]
MSGKYKDQQVRVSYTIPIIIKGKNIEGKAFVEKTVAENMTRRGVFFCTSQPLAEKSQVRIYSVDDPTKAVAKVEVVWGRKNPMGFGAKLIGRNDKWIEFLLKHSIAVAEDFEEFGESLVRSKKIE